METWETFTMSRKEVPRAGRLKAARAGRITNAQGALAERALVPTLEAPLRRGRGGRVAASPARPAGVPAAGPRVARPRGGVAPAPLRRVERLSRDRKAPGDRGAASQPQLGAPAPPGPRPARQAPPPPAAGACAAPRRPRGAPSRSSTAA